MRDHVMTTLRGASEDLQRLVAALDMQDIDEIVGTFLDHVDRLADERDWLRTQPATSLLDPHAKLAMSRYRMLVTRAHLQAEH